MTITIHQGTFFALSFQEGHFVIDFQNNIEGTPEQAWEWINCTNDIYRQLGRPYPLMSIVKDKVEFTSEARKIMRTVEDQERFVAHCVWAETPALVSMIKYLMILVPRDQFEQEVFSAKEQCKLWLIDQILNSKHKAVTEEEANSLKLQVSTKQLN